MWLIDCFFGTWKDYMVKYFHRYMYLITTAKHAVQIEPIKYLEKYMPVCLILSCAKEAIYMWQNSIFIFYINNFQRKYFNKILEKVCIFDSSTAKPETLLMDFRYWSRFRMRVIGRCETTSVYHGLNTALWQFNRLIMFTLYGHREAKMCLRGFRPVKIQTSLLSYSDELESWNFVSGN